VFVSHEKILSCRENSATLAPQRSSSRRTLPASCQDYANHTMNKILLAIALLLSLNSFSQEFKRLPNETIEDFAGRYKTDSSKLSGKVVEGRWNKQDAVFAFYADKEIENINDKNVEVEFIEGYIFIKTAENVYNRIYIDRYFPEGADAEIESVFFANADNDKEKELIVLCSWDQNRHAAPISGKLYQIYFYDNINSQNLPKTLAVLNLETTFKFEFDGTNDAGEVSKAKYINVYQIKQELKRLGF
jgi:hypothetical protein